MKKAIYIIGTILIVGLSIVAIHYYSETYKLETQLSRLESRLSERNTNEGLNADDVIAFAKADSLAASGNYQQALSAYKELETRYPDGLAQNRIKLINKIRSINAVNQQLREEAGDSIIKRDTLMQDTELEKMDSLSFALDKAQLQLKNLQNQLIQKSFGEYITFKSTKGNRLFYVGEVEGGKANGYGIAILDSGSRYEGQWRNNKRHGNGKFYWVDGERYEGEYKNDVRSGQGTYYWPNGQKYVGSWEDDKRNGQGKFFDENGDIVAEGVWKNDELVEEK